MVGLKSNHIARLISQVLNTTTVGTWSLYTQVWTKWLSFCRWNIQVNFIRIKHTGITMAISLRFASECPVNDNPLVRVMAWRNCISLSDFEQLTNASLLLCEKPPTSTISSDIKDAISIKQCSFHNFMLILLYTLWSVQHWLSKTLFTKQLNHTPKLWNTNFVHVYRPKNNKCFWIAEIRQFILVCNIVVQHTHFNKSEITFQAVQGNTWLTLLEELWYKSGGHIVLHTDEHQLRSSWPCDEAPLVKIYLVHICQYPGLALERLIQYTHLYHPC